MLSCCVRGAGSLRGESRGEFWFAGNAILVCGEILECNSGLPEERILKIGMKKFWSVGLPEERGSRREESCCHLLPTGSLCDDSCCARRYLIFVLLNAFVEISLSIFWSTEALVLQKLFILKSRRSSR